MRRPRLALARSTLVLALALATPLTAADDPATLKAGDTPTLTLEQTGSFGLLPQSWQVGDSSGLQIHPAYGSSSDLYIATDGDIGMGTEDPEAALHISSDGDTNDTDLLVEETSSTEAARVLATLKNNGRVLLLFEDTSANGDVWRLRSTDHRFTIDADGVAGNELDLNSTTGDLTIQGSYSSSSSRDKKTNVQSIDPHEILEKISALPVNTWSYKSTTGQKHLGPMAEDFFQVFGLGASNTHISATDTSGVAIAAIQALSQQLQQKQEEIDLLKARLQAIEARLAN